MKSSNEEINENIIKSYVSGDLDDAYKYFGTFRANSGYIFRVYAPNAECVYLNGDFNNWKGERMLKNEKYGYWYLQEKNACLGDFYKFVIKNENNYIEHTDPYAKFIEQGGFASKIIDSSYEFSDNEWISNRDKNFEKPLNIYEVHLGSWKYFKHKNYLEIAEELVKYIKSMGYTHVELMPLTEYPFDPSWGYQTTGFFAATSRYGQARDLKMAIDIFHKNKIGVILDFVLAHFASDDYGLKNFDSKPLYESDFSHDWYSEWGSLNFDYSKGHVRSFIKSAISFWIEEFHVDGIRMDAVNNLIYWGGDKNRGENNFSIEFLKDLNNTLERKYPTVMKIAEDSSSYNYVTVSENGNSLGFDYKWDLGWMNDTFKFLSTDSLYRKNCHNLITWSMYYFYNEKFILPVSHDEVVHLKKPIVKKMFGEYEQKFKQLKLFFIYQMTHPGKKLNFMGNDIAQMDEWMENEFIDWEIIKFPIHDAYHNFVKDINFMYKNNRDFYELDYKRDGFEWVVVNDYDNSVFAYIRKSGEKKHFVVLNMSNVYIQQYKFIFKENYGLVEIINSLDQKYSGNKWDTKRNISTKNKELKLELFEYEAIVFELFDRIN
ncbi:MAG: 1,4-alpha-glucan branching protein GlgB [Peptoniphilaceae bacterium]|nr:1,4-alpha-glucan branching protein GlgB [Peptoniphilaceae bacterium]MDD7383566.1 1,4-alpha-glucan branching protein GlgB [Peptoniphilaceae bacterium]MDY3738739.1 1,4-alpha-glucan branching protein GlgB [Peptoniphilaceae bacterium]